jgi:hypothetical protein
VVPELPLLLLLPLLPPAGATHFPFVIAKSGLVLARGGKSVLLADKLQLQISKTDSHIDTRRDIGITRAGRPSLIEAAACVAAACLAHITAASY